MLINKCKLFSEGGNQELVALYLAHAPDLTFDVLADHGNSPEILDWWDATLQKTVSKESLQQMFIAAMDKGSQALHTASFIYRNLNDEDKGRLYKKAIGLRDDQSICLQDIFPTVAACLVDGAQNEAYKNLTLALDDNYSDDGKKWLALEWAVNKMPVPQCIENDLHQLVLQLRQMLIAGFQEGDQGTRSTMDIISGFFYSMLWQNGNADMVKCLLNEGMKSTVASSSQQKTQEFNKWYLNRAVIALTNTKLDSNLRAMFFDAILDGKHGEIEKYKLVPLLKCELLPNEYVHQVVDYISKNTGSHGSTKIGLSQEQQSKLAKILNDKRLTPLERKQLIDMCAGAHFIPHDYILFSRGKYKHVCELTQTEIKRKLNSYTGSLIDVDDEQTLISLLSTGDVELINPTLINEDGLGEELVHSSKRNMIKSKQPLSIMLRNDVLPPELLYRLSGVILNSNFHSLISLLASNKNLPTSVLNRAHEFSKGYSDHDMDADVMAGVHSSLLAINLSQKSTPIDLIRHNVNTHMGGNELSANKFRHWQHKDGIPTSMHALIAAMDYQPGDAFELLGKLMEKRPDWGLPVDGKPNPEADASRKKMGHVEVLVNLAMTKEIYPAILSGGGLDLDRTANLLALAVQNCQIDEFDINLLDRIRNRDLFTALANSLLSNPDFIQGHQQAYEALLAGVLKRKADACTVPVMAISSQRPTI